MNEDVKSENLRIHSRADELIACLEGEIAKRDARIVGLESQYQRDVCGLNNEGDPIGGDPAGGYANDNARLRAELSAIKAQEPVGFAITDNDTGKLLPHAAFFMNRAKAEKLAALTGGCSVAPLYAAPVSEAKAQGVVMPEQDGSDAQIAFWAGFEFAVCGLHNNDIRAAWNDFKSSERFKRLNAAPAAPAADAGVNDHE